MVQLVGLVAEFAVRVCIKVLKAINKLPIGFSTKELFHLCFIDCQMKNAPNHTCIGLALSLPALPACLILHTVALLAVATLRCVSMIPGKEAVKVDYAFAHRWAS